MTGSNIWNEVLSRIETKVNRHIFYTWFKPTSFVGDTGSRLDILVPNANAKIAQHHIMRANFNSIISQQDSRAGRVLPVDRQKRLANQQRRF